MKKRSGPVRYAVVGLGHIAQVAVLPAFAHATSNSRLEALVSDDPAKLDHFARKYGVLRTSNYAGFDRMLRENGIDAVFIATPNPTHRGFTERAAAAGVHVLCEKPLAMTETDALQMIRATRKAGVRLMTAYRLHFEHANLSSIELIRAGRIGEPRIFTSTFGMQVKPDNIRVAGDSGGPLFDLGVYCINAARYLFGEEPLEVSAFAAKGKGKRFRKIPEAVSAVLRFPGERLATFTCSFGCADVDEYRVVGTKGDLCLAPAYAYAETLQRSVTIEGRTKEEEFPKRDQFAPELLYFSDCILKGREPEPSGEEGLADLRVMTAIGRSIRSGRRVAIGGSPRRVRPSLRQEIRRAPIDKPEHYRARTPHS